MIGSINLCLVINVVEDVYCLRGDVYYVSGNTNFIMEWTG